MTRALLVVIAVAMLGCRGAPAELDDGACACAPGNRALTKSADGAVIDGAALLGKLRRHRRDVEAHRTPRDIKVQDDQLRFEVSNYCQPCGAWVRDRMTVEEMYPLEKLDDAADAVCMGLVLRDGTTAWGIARPKACR